MIPIVSLSAGLFLLIATVWAGRLAQNTVAAIFGVFSAFWLSFGFLLITAIGWCAATPSDPRHVSGQTQPPAPSAGLSGV